LSITAKVMELFDMRSTKDIELHCFDEDGVKRTHNVLKKATRRVENLHGACNWFGFGFEVKKG
jgi:translation initiation factor 2 alpha subunit (eIF-2alpha)